MLSTTLLALFAIAPQGAEWPHYRGPDRTGSVAARDWSPTGQPEPLWAKNVGKGYSCPSIVGDRLVTMGFHEQAGVDRIACLDRTTGVEHWHYDFAATDEPQYHGGGTLTTPSIRAGQVYCLNRGGKFHVLDLDSGKLVWSRDYQKELTLEQTFHGFCASPLLEGDHIYLQFGGLVAAVNANDGTVLWRTEDRGDLSYSNLALLRSGDTPALGAVIGMAFVVLRREDGEILHEYPWQLQGNAVHCAVPLAIGADRVFLSTAYNKGCAMLRLGKDKALEKVWANRRMRNKVTACVEHEGHLYGFDESMLRCVDLDGNSKWRVRGLGLGSLSMAGGRLLVLSSDGELIVAEATPDEFRELSRRKVLDGGVYWTMPVLVDGLIYVRNSRGDLRCLDYRSDAVAGADAPAHAAPKPADLFANHAGLVGKDEFRREGKALRLRGTWSIPLRGMAGDEMVWTLVAPNGWDLRADERLFYTFDGQRAWAVEPQGPRMIVDDELFEHRHLFGLPEMFTPACPGEASVTASPVRFAETPCWQVRSKVGGRDRAHYFDVETGRLVGCDGQGQSTLVFRGSQRLSGLTLPQSITRFRAEDGQEHVMRITAAEWIDRPADLFALPPAIVRVLRTPAELARDTAALQARFAGALARYQAKDKGTPLRDDIIELRVRDGDLWFVSPEAPYRVAVEQEVDGASPLEGPPIRIALVDGPGGKAKAIKVLMPGGGALLLLRLPD